MVFIGIDPGASGGIAVIWLPIESHIGPEDRGRRTKVFQLHGKSERDIIDELARWNPQVYQGLGHVHAALEHVWSTPGQGGAFAFGKSVGVLLGGLAAARIPFDQVLPRTWQKALGITYPKGAGDTVKKNITKRRAQQLFPAIADDITHATADALLLAEYARRVYHLTEFLPPGPPPKPNPATVARYADKAYQPAPSQGKGAAHVQEEGGEGRHAQTASIGAILPIRFIHAEGEATGARRATAEPADDAQHADPGARRHLRHDRRESRADRDVAGRRAGLRADGHAADAQAQSNDVEPRQGHADPHTRRGAVDRQDVAEEGRDRAGHTRTRRAAAAGR